MITFIAHQKVPILTVSFYHACLLSKQEGVGDTNDSFAYDGHRVRKWNVSTAKYGEVQYVYSTCLVTVNY